MTAAMMEAALQRLPMLAEETAMRQLQPLPIDFDPVAHRYTWVPTGERMMMSVTGVLSASKSKRTLQTFANTKHIWAPRGTHVHAVLEQHLKGNRGPVTGWSENYEGPHEEYCRPLLSYPLWETFEPLALEYRVCDLRRNIGGSLDVLGWDHMTDRMVLLDLKTLGRGGRQYSTDAQLGGYLSMLIEHHKLVVDECLTMWAGYGECHLGASQPPTKCLDAWENAYDIWRSTQDEL